MGFLSFLVCVGVNYSQTRHVCAQLLTRYLGRAAARAARRCLRLCALLHLQLTKEKIAEICLVLG